jgi:hypothetical protein
MNESIVKAAKARMAKIDSELNGVKKVGWANVTEGGAYREAEAARTKVLGAQRDHNWAKERVTKLETEYAELQAWLDENDKS